MSRSNYRGGSSFAYVGEGTCLDQLVDKVKINISRSSSKDILTAAKKVLTLWKFKNFKILVELAEGKRERIQERLIHVLEEIFAELRDLNQLKEVKVTKNAKREFIKYKLMTDDRWLLRALHRVAGKQTETEYKTEETREHNDVGFSASDASILTSFAKQHARKGQLSERQMKWLRKLLVKYSGQIVAMSDTEKLEAHIRGNWAEVKAKKTLLSDVPEHYEQQKLF